MRFKKLFVAKKLGNGETERSSKKDFEVELKPYEDEVDLDQNQTKIISYELHFPYINGTFLLDLNLLKGDNIRFSVRFPELFYVNHFIEKFGMTVSFSDSAKEGNVKKTKYCKFSFTGPEATGSLGSIRKTFCKVFSNKELEAAGADLLIPTILLINFTLTDTLATLLCDFESIQTEVISEALEKKKFIQKYNNNLGLMLKDETEFRDFTIIVGFSQIKVHKCVLASQSSVLAQMLSSDMIESRNSTLEISDMSEETVKFAIEFMYTGEILINSINSNDATVYQENLEEILAGLFVFAQKYNMVNLKLAMMTKCLESVKFFRANPEKKHRLIQTVSLHEPNMRDLDSFLAILGPYSVE